MKTKDITYMQIMAKAEAIIQQRPFSNPMHLTNSRIKREYPDIDTQQKLLISRNITLNYTGGNAKTKD